MSINTNLCEGRRQSYQYIALSETMNFKVLVLFATIILALIVFGGSSHALREDVRDLSLKKVPGSLIDWLQFN